MNTFGLFGSTTTSAAGADSICFSSASVDGFIVSPPSTTVAPDVSKSSRLPAPTDTATTAVFVASASPPSSRPVRSAVWRCMFATSTASTTPIAVASWRARPGSSVCTCTLIALSSPTTSSESPKAASSRSSASASRFSPSITKPVQ